MRKIHFFLIMLILGVLQATILNSFSVFGIKPDVLLISVVIASLSFELKWALAFSVFAGIVKDVLGVYTIGINTLIFPLWTYLIIRLSKKISLDNNLMPALFILVISTANNIIIKLIFSSFQNLVIPLGIFVRIMFLESIYTAFIFHFILKFTKPALY